MTRTTLYRTAQTVALIAAVFAAALLLGGCIPVAHKLHSSGGDSIDHPAHPLSDDATIAQVVEPAKQIVAVAGLQGVRAGFDFVSCNDQGDPPYQGKVVLAFDLPPGANPDEYFKTIAAKLVAVGWTDGSPPGQHLAGTVVNKDGVSASMGPMPWRPGKGSIDLYGECRNMTDHHHDDPHGIDVTSKIR